MPQKSNRPPQRHRALPPPRPHQQTIPSLPDEILRAKRVAILGVGSELRGDDAVGVVIAQKLGAWARSSGARRLAAFVGSSAPENVTGEIGRFKPDCLVLVDAAHLGLEPGDVALVPRESIEGLSFSTHMLPATIVLDYLEKTTGCRSFVLGIQVEQTDLLAELSPAVARACRSVVKVFSQSFGQ